VKVWEGDPQSSIGRDGSRPEVFDGQAEFVKCCSGEVDHSRDSGKL